jgi:hypothetical protein
MGLQTFHALPSQSYSEVTDGYKCIGDCGNCKVCYEQTQGKYDKIYVKYHGGRVGSSEGNGTDGRIERKQRTYAGINYNG